MKEVSQNDKMAMDTVSDIDADNTHITRNFTGSSMESYIIFLDRKVTVEDIRNFKQDKMPGFRFTWKYNKEVEPWSRFKGYNNQFTRLVFFNCHLI